MGCCGSWWRGGRSGRRRTDRCSPKRRSGGGQARDPAPQGLDRQAAAGQQRRTEGWLALGEAQQVRRDPHLAITVVAGADANHGDRQLPPQAGGQIGRHMLEHQGKTAGRLQVEGCPA